MSDIFDPTELGVDADEATGVAQTNYEGATSFFRPPDPGRETYVIPSENRRWGKTSEDKGNNIYISGLATIVGGVNDGKRVRFFFSDRKDSFREGSTLIDFVLATNPGVKPANGTTFTKGELGELTDKGLDKPFKGRHSWEYYCKDGCKTTTRPKAKELPRNSEGVLLHVVNCPKCGNLIGAEASIKSIFLK